MADLLRFMEAGRLDLVVILGLILALVWTIKQWRAAEKGKDELHNARLKDAKEMVELAVEVKNSVESLVKVIGDRRAR